MNKKTLAVLCSLILVVVAATIIALMLRGDAEIEPTVVQGEEVTTETTVEYTRTYPEHIYGNWEPSPQHMRAMLQSEVDALRELGVNTVSVVLNYTYQNGEVYLRGAPAENADALMEEYNIPPEDVEQLRQGNMSVLPDGFPVEQLMASTDTKQFYIDQIVAAHDAGFAVLLAPDFVGGSGQLETDKSMDAFLEDARAVALEWAEIAEEYAVEYYAPQNELDLVVRTSYSSFESPDSVYAPAINAWHSDILPEVQERFTGKSMYKLGWPSSSFFAEGYDYIAVDFSPSIEEPEEFRSVVRGLYQEAERSAELSGAEWLVGEMFVPYREMRGLELGDTIVTQRGNSYDDLQDDMYRVALEEYENFDGSIQPSGFIFAAYTLPGMDIRDRDAEDVISTFFNR